MPYLEPIEVARVHIPDADMLDLRGGGSLSDALDHLLDGGQVAFDMGFNVAIRAIAHPTR